MNIPFNKPFITGREEAYLQQVIAKGPLAGDGPFTKRCQSLLEEKLGAKKALLTHSCTAALEMAAILAGVGPGDEVIMPSYTFVSTANAFALRGATPVFVDIRPDTLNIDERLIEKSITPHTKAIVVVHYAGVACEMDTIMEVAVRHSLIVIEDAAHAVLSTYKGRHLGSIGHLATLSFHETKNIVSGEGGALLINDERYIERAEIIWEKGTNRKNFFRGLVDKYTWMDIGSSFLPSELTAAFLCAQLEQAEHINSLRMEAWNRYRDKLKALDISPALRLPIIPEACAHNAHLFHLVLPSRHARDNLLKRLRDQGIGAVFHYIPLHDSPAGLQYGRAAGALPETNAASERLLRLPLWPELPEEVADQVCVTIEKNWHDILAD